MSAVSSVKVVITRAGDSSLGSLQFQDTNGTSVWLVSEPWQNIDRRIRQSYTNLNSGTTPMTDGFLKLDIVNSIQDALRNELGDNWQSPRKVEVEVQRS